MQERFPRRPPPRGKTGSFRFHRKEDRVVPRVGVGPAGDEYPDDYGEILRLPGELDANLAGCPSFQRRQCPGSPGYRAPAGQQLDNRTGDRKGREVADAYVGGETAVVRFDRGSNGPQVGGRLPHHLPAVQGGGSPLPRRVAQGGAQTQHGMAGGVDRRKINRPGGETGESGQRVPGAVLAG